jgi:hypothetical protein
MLCCRLFLLDWRVRVRIREDGEIMTWSAGLIDYVILYLIYFYFVH